MLLISGLYVPSIAAYIVRAQLDMKGPNDAPPNGVFLDIKGIAVGNGVIDDVIQAATYAEYAYYHGLIPLQAKLKFDAQYARCMENEASNVKGAALPKSGMFSGYGCCVGTPSTPADCVILVLDIFIIYANNYSLLTIQEGESDLL